MASSEYQSPFSVAKRQTLYIDANDPRVRGFMANLTAAKSGAEIVIIGDKSLYSGGEFSFLRGSGSQQNNKNLNPVGEDFLTPTALSNVSVEWEELSGGPALVVSFDFDFDDSNNKYVNSFGYTLTGNGETTPLIESVTLNKTGTSQRVEFTYALNTQYYGIFQTSFTELKIAAYDSFGKNGPITTITIIPTYTADLCTPTITVTSIPMGYSVNLTDICNKPYEFISVEEIVSDAGTAPTTGYQQIYLSDIKPANIITPTTDARWVKARYTSKSGLYGPYSNAVKVTPTNPISVDLIPPSEIASVSAVWSGDNIVVSYTLPSTDAGVRFKIALTAPNSSVGYFYFFPVAGTLNQTAIISKADLFLQFGSHYSSYTGLIKSIDAADNQSSGVAFTVGARVNPLLGVTPTFTTTALVNGYNVSYTLPAGAVYAEVYQKYTSWSGVTPYDSFTGSYASGGASGTNTVTLSNVLSNKGVAVTPLIGFIVIGTGIPENTYITAVSGNQITVNNNFTSQVSGSITGYGIVYSGTSPANISSTLYQNTYLLVRYYDDFENPSNYSAEQIVVPLSPVTVDINGPGNVATVAASTSGIDTSGTLGFNGYINLNWTAVSDTTLRGYRIRFTTDTSNPVYSYVDFPIDQSNPPTGTISYKLIGLAVGATYKIGVATYDEYNNTSSAYTSFTDVTITGTPALSNYIESGTAGFQFGSGIKDKTGVQNASAQGIYLSNSNYWYLTSANSAQFKVGGPSANYLEWNGTKLTVDGDITAKGGSFAGNIALTTSGASIYSGDVTTSPGNLTGDGFIFNKDGLLIRKGSNQVSLDTTNGAITANAGNIADWVISASKIEKLDPTSTKYAGLSSTGLYKFWSGSTSAGGDETQFAVNRDGKLFAKSVQISGGTLDIGALPTNLTSGFHVLTDGTMYATGAQVNGAITATSGKITGNFQVESGSFYTGTSPTNTSVIINDKGLASIGATNNTLTAIVNTPISSGNIPLGDNPAVGALPTAITFFTKAALIGGWVVNDTSIRDRSEQFILHSTDKRISITGVIDVSTNYRVRFGTDLTGSGSGTVNIFEAGVDGQTPNFYITRGGILNATGAVINGNITATTMTSTGNFSFAGGILQGTTNSLTLNGANFILTDTSGGDDGTAGDPTVTRIINPAAVGGVPDGKIVTGRAIWYGGNNTPTSAITSRYAFNNTFGGSQGYIGGVPRYTSSNPGNFATGDLYMTIV